MYIAVPHGLESLYRSTDVLGRLLAEKRSGHVSTSEMIIVKVSN